MQSSKIQAAVLAGFFGIAATGSLLTGSVRLAGTSPSLTNGAPLAALADDEHKHGDQDDEDEGDHHDNGKHKGWSKHHHGQNGNSVLGTIRNINGNLLNVQLQNGQYLTVNDQSALNNGQANNIGVGEYVRLFGTYGNNGQFYATRVLDANNSDTGNNSGYGDNNGYPNGNNNGNNYPNQNNCNTNNYNQGTQTITGYQTGTPDGSGRFQMITQQSGIPIPGQTYTVVTSNQTCFTTQLGGIGKRLTVVGFPSGDGRTIKAVRISG